MSPAPVRNKTPDWPYDIDRVIRRLDMRRQGHASCMALLAAALRQLGHPALALERGIHCSTYEALESDPSGRALLHVRECDQVAIALNGKVLSPYVDPSWEKMLRRAHKKTRARADLTEYDVESTYMGEAYELKDSHFPEDVGRVATWLRHYPTANYGANPSSPTEQGPDEAVIAMGRAVMANAGKRWRAADLAVALMVSLQAQDIPACALREVREETSKGETRLLHDFFIEYGSPVQRACLNDIDTSGAVTLFTPSAKGRIGTAVGSEELLFTVRSARRVGPLIEHCEPMVALLVERHLAQLIPGPRAAGIRARM